MRVPEVESAEDPHQLHVTPNQPPPNTNRSHTHPSHTPRHSPDNHATPNPTHTRPNDLGVHSTHNRLAAKWERCCVHCEPARRRTTPVSTNPPPTDPSTLDGPPNGGTHQPCDQLGPRTQRGPVTHCSGTPPARLSKTVEQTNTVNVPGLNSQNGPSTPSSIWKEGAQQNSYLSSYWYQSHSLTRRKGVSTGTASQHHVARTHMVPDNELGPDHRNPPTCPPTSQKRG